MLQSLQQPCAEVAFFPDYLFLPCRFHVLFHSFHEYLDYLNNLQWYLLIVPLQALAFAGKLAPV